MASVRFVRFALGAMRASGAVHLAGSALRGAGVIFCMHQVRPGAGIKNGFAPNFNLACSPLFLGELIGLARRRGYETLSLGQAVSRLKSAEKGAKPFAVFTLDDGYRDNKVHGQPVFQKHECPYTIFVAPRIIEGTCELWWQVLELIVAKTDRFRAVIKGRELDLPAGTTEEKEKTWRVAFSILYHMEELQQRRAVRELATKYDVSIETVCREEAMNWNEVREISRDPLCTIGAHTISHYSLSKLSDADSFHELHRSRLEIEKGLGKPVLFNAYPYGNKLSARAREFAFSEKAGYDASVTTRHGVVFPEHVNHLHALPRIMISGRYHDIDYVDALMSGLPAAFLNRFKHVNLD